MADEVGENPWIVQAVIGRDGVSLEGWTPQADGEASPNGVLYEKPLAQTPGLCKVLLLFGLSARVTMEH